MYNFLASCVDFLHFHTELRLNESDMGEALRLTLLHTINCDNCVRVCVCETETYFTSFDA